MTSTIRPLCAALLFLLAGLALPAHSQEARTSHQQVISANPFGLLLEFFNAEYERGVSRTGTMGVGGSFASYEDELTDRDERYFNVDAFYRYYPQGTVFSGWNFGVKLGEGEIDVIPTIRLVNVGFKF